MYNCRFFKEELSRVPECGEVRSNVLRAIRDVEQEILATLKKQKEAMERENCNLEKALEMISKSM